MKQIIALLICLAAVPAMAEMATIKGESVNLRNGPGKNYGIEWKYGNGLPVKIVKKQGDWIKITDFEGESGWVFHTLLAKQRNIIINANKNSEAKINIREMPNTNSAIIAQAHHGVIFTLLQQQGDWLEVKHDAGVAGWINKKFAWGY